MQPRRIQALIMRQFCLMRGSPARVVPLFAWVGIDIVLWGFLTRYLNTVSSARFSFVPALLGAVLLWDFLVRVLHGITTAFLEDIWSRNFLNLFASPLSVGEYVCGLVATSLMTAAVGLVFMLVVAGGLFGLSFAAMGAMLVPFLLVLMLFGIALGIVGTAIVLRFGPAAEWFIWPLPALISPFVGVMYPVSTLPVWMQYVSRAFAPSYVFESMRGIVTGTPASPLNLVWGSLLSLATVWLAYNFFVRIFRHAVEQGLIARYSAESVS